MILRGIISSLAAFFATGMRPRTPLAKAIVAILVIKLAGIMAARVFMFADSARPAVDAAAMARVIGASSAAH
jgi:hypothetical protein